MHPQKSLGEGPLLSRLQMKVREEAYGLSQGWEDLTSVYGPPTDFLLVGGLGSLEIAAADPGHEATESGTCFLNGVFFTFF